MVPHLLINLVIKKLGGYHRVSQKYKNNTLSQLTQLKKFQCLLAKRVQRDRSSVTEGLAVKVVFSMTWANTLEVGDVTSKLLDGLNLLMQVVALDKVGHLHHSARR